MKVFKIGVCLKAEENPFWSLEVRKGIELASKDNNIKLIYSSPKSIDDVKDQLKILNDFIKKDVDAIVLAPIISPKVEQFVKKTNIPILVLDTKLESSKYFLGFDDYEGGYQTGKNLIKYLDRSSKAAIVEGPKKGSFTRRVDGFKDATKGYLPVIDTISANFKEDESYRKTKQLLTRFKDLDAIFYTSDNMAMGGLTATYELEKDIIICGFDATHSGKLAVKKERMLSTIDTHPQKLGELSILKLIDLLNGKEIETEVLIQIDLITKESLKSIPKEAVQKREYILVDARQDCSEYEYKNLHDSTECPIIFGNDYKKDLTQRLKLLDADKFIIVTDSIVKNLYGQDLKDYFQKNKLDVEMFFFPAGEKNKTFTTLNFLANQILNSGISKRSCLILLGGGIVGNLAGFLAAILMRGIKFVHVPTTVMSQIDSTTGGKQAVNTRHGKNLLGTFYEPEFIYINTNFIETLPRTEYESGIAEAIKHGLCQSRKLLELIQTDDYSKIVKETIRLKIMLIDADPREKKEGLILVYGHTLGHVIEILSKHKLNHGQAISLGMIAAAKISYKMGFCEKSLIQFHEKILNEHNLPIKIPGYIDSKSIIKTLLYDKKERKKQVGFILLENIETIKIQENSYNIPVDENIILEVINEMQ